MCAGVCLVGCGSDDVFHLYSGQEAIARSVREKKDRFFFGYASSSHSHVWAYRCYLNDTDEVSELLEALQLFTTKVPTTPPLSSHQHNHRHTPGRKHLLPPCVSVSCLCVCVCAFIYSFSTTWWAPPRPSRTTSRTCRATRPGPSPPMSSSASRTNQSRGKTASDPSADLINV